MTFHKDLSEGKAKEVEVAQYYCDEYKVVQTHNKGGHDLELTLKVEVKFDRKAHQTGNYAIELMYRGKPSGLSTSEAHKWVLCSVEGCWEVDTSVLKDVTKRSCFVNSEWNTVSGGDGNLSSIALIPYDVVKSFKKLFQYATQEEKKDTYDRARRGPFD